MENEELFIIYGTGIVGRALLQVSKHLNIVCFCDDNINKVNRILEGVPVIHTSDLKNKYPNATFIISAADISDVINKLKSLGYTKWISSTSLLTVDNNPFSTDRFAIYAIQTCSSCHVAYYNATKIFFRSVDLIVTERCSLKCVGCSNLMQYYVRPLDESVNDLNRSVDLLLNVSDEINEVRILGGEPFMNKNVDVIVKRLIAEPKIHNIVIYTNGTIVPKEQQIENVKHEKVLFIITNYGPILSKKVNDLISVLSSNNIKFVASDAKGWTACADMTKHNRNVEEQIKLYNNCCSKNTFTLSKTKLFRCPFSANCHRLQSVPDFKTDYIELDKLSNIQELREFIYNKPYLETCDFCNGRSFDDEEISPGIQTPKPLQYNKIDYV